MCMNDASLVKIHCTMYHSTCEMICSALDFAHTNPSQITSFQKLHRARGRSGPAILCESCFLGARSIRMHESFATHTRRTRLDVPRRAYEMNLRVGVDTTGNGQLVRIVERVTIIFARNVMSMESVWSENQCLPNIHFKELIPRV